MAHQRLGLPAPAPSVELAINGDWVAGATQVGWFPLSEGSALEGFYDLCRSGAHRPTSPAYPDWCAWLLEWAATWGDRSSSGASWAASCRRRRWSDCWGRPGGGD